MHAIYITRNFSLFSVYIDHHHFQLFCALKDLDFKEGKIKRNETFTRTSAIVYSESARVCVCVLETKKKRHLGSSRKIFCPKVGQHTFLYFSFFPCRVYQIDDKAEREEMETQ